MNWDAVGAVGEVVGALAVVLTLLYLAAEMRRGRVAAEAASVDSLAAGWNQINASVMTDRELIEIFVRGSADPDALDPVERARFLGLGQTYLNHFQTVVRHRNAGTLPDKEWATHASGFANVMDSPGGRWIVEHGAVSSDVAQVMRDYRTDPRQFAAMKGAESA